jgi:hypothetical protein
MLSPYQLGQFARQRNEPKDNNPFDSENNSSCYNAWLKGWKNPYV